jgi:hypothetical protein
MNRAEKRRAFRNGELYHAKEVEQIAKGTAKDFLKQFVNDYTAAIALALRDELDFGHVRTKRVLDRIASIFDSINKGHLTVEDIKQTLSEEVRIMIR